VRYAAAVLLVLAAACSPAQPTASTSASPPASSPAAHQALSSGGVVEYALPAPSTPPQDCAPGCKIQVGSLVLGPDGNLWFDAAGLRLIGRMTSSGQVKLFPLPVDVAGGANRLAAGSDGNLWLTATGGGDGKPDWILRVTTSGEVTKLKAGMNPAGAEPATGPESIAEGPDGNMWFTEFWANRIGRMSPVGILSEYPIPTADSSPRGIVAGHDGNMWFVESGRSRPAIARITMSGDVTEFPVTDGPSDNAPDHIVSGPDGDLWFNEPSAIGHVSTQGKMTWMSLPEGTQPGELVTGPDGNIWFADYHSDSLVRLGVTGVLRKFPLPRRGMSIVGMAVGGDGRIWFGEDGVSSIGSIGVKVPEMLMSRRPLVFAGAAGQSVSVRNTGEAPLAISSVRVVGVDAALFSIGSNGCGGATVAPDASCKIEVRHASGGPAGIQAAILEIKSNATGSPQRLQLIAQAPECTLPVVGADAAEQLLVASAEVHFEATGKVGYYDRAYGRWLPVGPEAVSPDGGRYAYFPPHEGMASEIRVVDVATGAEKSLQLRPDFWGIIAFTNDGIYLHTAYEGYGPGATLLDPDTGALKVALTDTAVERIDGSTAWVTTWNTADKLPSPAGMGGGSNQVMKRDLVTGQTTVWLYRPGTQVYVVGAVGGSPVVNVWDGTQSTQWIVTAPNQARLLEYSFSGSVQLSTRGFISDSTGLWIGSDDGVYLWTPRTGAVLVTEQAVTPAGTCA
jgi:streptogramin lyase